MLEPAPSRLAVLALALGSLVALAPVEAEAASVSRATAQKICIKATAAKYTELLGNVYVKRFRPHRAGYEFGLEVRGKELNCIVGTNGKIRFIS